MNVDPNEINKFASLASRWWDKSSEFKTLHDINPLRLSYIQQFQPVADLAVIDVGCGGGILTEGLAKLGGNLTGIDLAEASIKVADLHALDSGLNIHYHVISAEQMASDKPQTFDVVVCMEMLEHVPDPSSIIHACSTMLKPGGWAFFSTLNRTFKARALAIGAESSIFWPVSIARIRITPRWKSVYLGTYSFLV